MKRKLQIIIKLVFIWLLMIDILSFIWLNIFSRTILNQNYILSQLEKEKYYENVYKQIQSSFEGYIAPSGFDETILNGIYSEEKVKQDIINVVNYIYTGKEYEINTEQMQEKLQINIYESLLNYNVSEEEKKSITQFEKELISEYQKQVSHNQYFDKLANYFPKIIENISSIKISMVAIGLGIIVILVFINKRNFVKFIKAITISVLGSGLFLLFVKFWIISKIEISNISILSDTFSKVISNILGEILWQWGIIGIILTIVCIILLIIFNILLYKDNTNKKIKIIKSTKEKRRKRMEELDLRQIMKTLWNKKVVILIVALLSAILGGIYSYKFVTPKYESSTTLVLAKTDEQISNTIESSAITQTDLSLNQNLVSTYRELIRSKTVLRKVLTNLEIYDLKEEELKRNISVNSVKDTELIEITVSNTNPKQAADIANEVANVFSEEVADIYNINNIHVVDKAEEEKEPYNINHIKDISIFAFIGIVISIAYILIQSLLDNTVKDQETVEKSTELLVLAQIPEISFEIKIGGKK